MRATILPLAIILTKARRATVSIYDGQGEYCGLNTDSEVFLIVIIIMLMLLLLVAITPRNGKGL